MQLLRHRVFAGLLVLVGAATAPVIACGSDDPVASVDAGPDASTILTADGASIPASCGDGIKNYTETDIDCGGSCEKCQYGKGCATVLDCTDGACKDTGAGLQCQTPSNTDGIKNGNETGIDCGGTGNPRCADTMPCAVGADCKSSICKDTKCAVPTNTDGAQNGNESDIDCGGTSGILCDDGRKCFTAADCKNNVCKDLVDGSGLRCQAP